MFWLYFDFHIKSEPSIVNAQKAPLSCRLHVSLQGLEWSIYNRTAAYDNVVSAMQSNVSNTPEESHAPTSGEGIGSLRKIFSWTSVVPECMSPSLVRRVC